MFKDYNKYLKASLKVYIFVLLIVFILKLVGLDYFGLDASNPTLNNISDTLVRTGYSDSIIAFTVYLQFYLYLCMVCNKRHLFMYSLIGTLINLTIQVFLVAYLTMDWLYYILCFSLMLIVPMFVNKKISFKKQIKFILLLSLYQLISMFIRNVGVNSNYNNFLLEQLLNIDQLLMLAITYNIYFMKGGSFKCLEVEAGYSLLKKKHLLDLLEKLQRNYSNFKKYNKIDKATIVIYTILSLIWNIFTIIVVLFVAKLNDTFIECLFIISSFWLSKKVFGKPFHLKSMMGCFIVSNVSYYVLNRVTTPIGISILVPIMLGVGLSYVTSKFVKDIKPLFKGMSEEDFNNTILRVVEKDSDKYKICYDFFINKENAVSLGYKYHYTEHGIRKIIYRINEKIKALN